MTDEIAYTNRLAESFKLLEYKPEQKPDGSYTNNESETDTAAAYYLIPGTTIPLAPWLEITGKTDVPAYLYLEVKDGTPEKADAPLAEAWQPLKEGDAPVTGKNGGQIYVYTADGEALILTTAAVPASEPFRAGLLKKGLALDPVPEPNDGKLEFWGYLIQTVPDKTPTQVFNAIVNPAASEPETTNP